MWKSELIGDVFTSVSNGLSIKQKKEKSGLPITRIETIWDWDIDEDRLGYADIFDPEEYSRYLLQPGDILMSHINSMKHLGKCAIYRGSPEQLIHGMNLLSLKADMERLDPFYANYFFTSDFFKNQIEKIANQSVNQSSFSVSRLKTLKIPLPPLPIQRRIAAILDQADALRRKDAELLARYDALAQSVFLELFGDPVRNEKIKLIDVCEKITDGTHQSPKFKETGIPFLFVSNIVDNTIVYDTKKYISKAEYDSLYKRTPVEIGDVLITTVGSYGNAAMVKEEKKFMFQRHIGYLKPKKEVIKPTYLLAVLNSPLVKRQIEKKVKGVAQKTLNLKDLKSITFHLPSIEKQVAFQDIYENIEEQKELILEQQKKSEALFQSLLQKAFKGELVSTEAMDEIS